MKTRKRDVLISLSKHLTWVSFPLHNPISPKHNKTKHKATAGVKCQLSVDCQLSARIPLRGIKLNVKSKLASTHEQSEKNKRGGSIWSSRLYSVLLIYKHEKAPTETANRALTKSAQPLGPSPTTEENYLPPGLGKAILGVMWFWYDLCEECPGTNIWERWPLGMLCYWIVRRGVGM